MKQFKNAVAVAIAAAGLVSVSAMAGTAVHWAGSDAGSAKDVKWQVVQPSTLDFTITTRSISVLNGEGFITNGGPNLSQAGTWSSKGGSYTIHANELGGDVTTGVARGYQDRNEWLEYNLCDTESCPDGDRKRVDNYGVYSGTHNGFIRGRLIRVVGVGKTEPITEISKVKSSKFTANITVTKYTA